MSRLLPVTRPNKTFVQSQTFHILNSYKKIFLLLKRNSVDNLVGSNQRLVAPRQRPKSFSSSSWKLRSFAFVLSLLYVHCASSPTQRIVSNDLYYVKGVFHMCRKNLVRPLHHKYSDCKCKTYVREKAICACKSIRIISKHVKDRFGTSWFICSANKTNVQAQIPIPKIAL